MSATPDKTPPAADLLAECRRVLLIAQRAINNWICTYAPDQCSDEHVEQTHAEIGKYGTLAYLAYVGEEIRTLLARLSAEPAGAGWGVPDGWRLVPVQPTKTMLQACFKAYWTTDEDDDFDEEPLSRSAAYRTLLAAAPPPPAPEAHAVPCPRCDGTGYFQGGRRTIQQQFCNVCHGTGRVPEPAPVQTEGDAVERALRTLFEWYDLDGSVGGASIAFEEARAALSATARAVDVEAGAQWLAKNVMLCNWDGLSEGTCAPEYPPWKCSHYNAGKEDYRIAVRAILAAAGAGDADVEREVTAQQVLDWLRSRPGVSFASTIVDVEIALQALQPAPGKTGGA